MDIEELKQEGNIAFKLAKYKQACVLYGRCLEAMIEFERSTQGSSSSFDSLKPIIFLNLAAGNIKLLAYDGARRCCNAAILFCNDSSLKLSDLGVDDDLAVDIDVIRPVSVSQSNTAAKALFRRGQCHQGLQQLPQAYKDYLEASTFAPLDKAISDALRVCSSKLNELAAAQPQSVQVRDTSRILEENNTATHVGVDQLSSITMNGGTCFRDCGYWSQSVDDVQVYLRLPYLLKGQSMPANLAKFIRIEFHIQMILIHLNTVDPIHLPLARCVIAADCSWTIEDLQGDRPDLIVRCLVLHLQKAASTEWTAGAEWWDRVLQDDKPIDTMLCSIGADVAQLPTEARQEAEREHYRFMSLSQQARDHEQNQLLTMKSKYRDIAEQIDSEPGNFQEDTVFSLKSIKTLPRELIRELTVLDENNNVTDNLNNASNIESTLSSALTGLDERDPAAVDSVERNNINAQLDAESMTWLQGQFPTKKFAFGNV